MAISKVELKKKIQSAIDRHSDVAVEPKKAREEFAEDLADAIELYVVGRTTTVTGSSATGGAVKGVGVIDGN